MLLTLLSAVTANTTGAEQFAEKTFWRFDVKTAGGSVDATLALQYKSPAGDWITLDTRAYVTAANFTFQWTGPARYVRAVLSSYVAGTFTVTAEAL